MEGVAKSPSFTQLYKAIQQWLIYQVFQNDLGQWCKLKWQAACQFNELKAKKRQYTIINFGHSTLSNQIRQVTGSIKYFKLRQSNRLSWIKRLINQNYLNWLSIGKSPAPTSMWALCAEGSFSDFLDIMPTITRIQT